MYFSNFSQRLTRRVFHFRYTKWSHLILTPKDENNSNISLGLAVPTKWQRWEICTGKSQWQGRKSLCCSELLVVPHLRAQPSHSVLLWGLRRRGHRFQGLWTVLWAYTAISHQGQCQGRADFLNTWHPAQGHEMRISQGLILGRHFQLHLSGRRTV